MAENARRWAAGLVLGGVLGCSSGADEQGSSFVAEDTAPADTFIDDTTSAADAQAGDSGETGVDASTPTGSAGCGKAASSGVTNAVITVAGVMRTYALSIPAGYDASKPYPLVFGWHGRGGNGPLFRTYSGVEKQAGSAAVFVYPNGLPVTADVLDTGWILEAGGRDVALFDALHAELSSKLCIDGKRVFSFGHSFGGYMSNVLGCQRGKVLRAIAPVAGGGPYGACAAPVAAWIAHAKDDPVVAVSEGTKSRDSWSKLSGCGSTTAPVSPDPCVAYQGCNPSAPLTWCNPSFGGHNWPPFAAQGIWGFFAGS